MTQLNKENNYVLNSNIYLFLQQSKILFVDIKFILNKINVNLNGKTFLMK